MMNAYIKKIDQQITDQHLLTHPFYQAWSRGELTKECLADYAAQYYHHVKAFPTYLSALHSHTSDLETRKQLLENLIEEEGGSPNHPEMWFDFAMRFGCSKTEVESQSAIFEIEHLIETFREICLKEDVASGIASLYAYESQIPSICQSKIDGLKRFYKMKKPEDWKYFSVHITADQEHSAVEKRLLEKYIKPENFESVQTNVQKVLRALWNFLSAMCRRHGIECAV